MQSLIKMVFPQAKIAGNMAQVTISQILQYKQKPMQSHLYKILDEEGLEWLSCHIDSRKLGAVVICRNRW